MNDYSQTVILPKTAFPMKADLARREPGLLGIWEQEDIYTKMLAKNAGKRSFILHDGPPYANGHIHLGTALNKILKDAVVKFQTLRGFYAPYIPGWDCHGMPIEHQVFQERKLEKGRVDVVKFRKDAKAYAEKFVVVQREEFKRLGIFGDWNNPYLTLNPAYEKIIIESFGQLYSEGYIVRGYKPIYWCCRCSTALAEAEVEYSDETSPSIYVKFPISDASRKKLGIEGDAYFLIWTTTPWTLPANVAIAVHPDLTYCLVSTPKGNLLLADSLVAPVLEKLGLVPWKLVKKFSGQELEGIVCRHPFIERDSVVVLASYVSDTDGTGCVHTAPGHGEEDYLTGKAYGLPILCPVDERGRFTDEVERWKGMQVFDADAAIVDYLRGKGILLGEEKYVHSYPHCWRCKKPVIFRATRQWFLKIDHNGLRTRMKEEISNTRWIPEEGQNRIAGMVETRPDWCLSRQRLWGVALPVFYCEQCEQPICTKETIAKVAWLVEKHGSNIWFEKPAKELMPDGFTCPQCKSTQFRKENDILDVWFDSGISHRAVLKQHPALSWPADLYLEGSDQHRGWFQTSLITGCAIERKAPFRNVLTHGFVVDAEGRKMSKSLGNVITPDEIIKKYGADILRLWALSENYQQDMRISQTILEHLVVVYRTIRNTLRFLLGNLHDFSPELRVPEHQLLEVDSWAMERLMQLSTVVTGHYENFAFHKGVQEIFSFCNQDLSAFYLDYLKDRLYTYAKDSLERRAAQTVLADILLSLLVMLSPILSFTCDEAYRLIPWRKKESIFLEDWPELKPYHEIIFERWAKFMEFRKLVLKKIEEKRIAEEIGSSGEARIVVSADEPMRRFLESFNPHLPRLLMVSEVIINPGNEIEISVERTQYTKCERCWIYHPTVGNQSSHPTLCAKCAVIVGNLQ
jgi:isoleucyl-tRNA synthetase